MALWLSFLLVIAGHWPIREEGTEVGNGVQSAVDTMEIALQHKTSVHQLSFIPDRIRDPGDKP